jgi:hypothetical protein
MAAILAPFAFASGFARSEDRQWPVLPKQNMLMT